MYSIWSKSAQFHSVASFAVVFLDTARLDSNPGRRQSSPCPEPPSVSLLGSLPLQAFLRKIKVKPKRMLSHRLRLPTPKIFTMIRSEYIVERNYIQAFCMKWQMMQRLLDPIWKCSHLDLLAIH